MKRIALVILILYCLIFYTGCSVNQKEKASSESSTPGNNSIVDTLQETEENSEKRDCIIDDNGNLMVMIEGNYEPYNYDKFPEIPKKISRIISMLSEGDNFINFHCLDELHVYYGLEYNKSMMLGGNGVDIFNFSIDQEQDLIEFSVENLTFSGIDDDYRPQLLESFNLMFGESGEKIYQYFIPLYENPVVDMEDETIIDGMYIKYWCAPKHRLKIFLHQ